MQKLEKGLLAEVLAILGNQNYQIVSQGAEDLIRLIDDNPGKELALMEVILTHWRSANVSVVSLPIGDSYLIDEAELIGLIREWGGIFYHKSQMWMFNQVSESSAAQEMLDIMAGNNEKDRIAILSCLLSSKVCPYFWVKGSFEPPKEEEFSALQKSMESEVLTLMAAVKGLGGKFPTNVSEASHYLDLIMASGDPGRSVVLMLHFMDAMKERGVVSSKGLMAIRIPRTLSSGHLGDIEEAVRGFGSISLGLCDDLNCRMHSGPDEE